MSASRQRLILGRSNSALALATTRLYTVSQPNVSRQNKNPKPTAAGWEPEAITPVIQPLYGELWQRLASAGVSAAGPAVAYYEDAQAGDGAIVVHAAVPVVAEAGPDPGFNVVDLAEVETAAAIIHHGSMDDVMSTGQALARWIDANGYRSAGYAREVTLHWSVDTEQFSRRSSHRAREGHRSAAGLGGQAGPATGRGASQRRRAVGLPTGDLPD